MREWNLPRSPRPPMCGSCLSSRYPMFFVDETTYAVAHFLVQREWRVSLMQLFKEIPWTPRQTFPPLIANPSLILADSVGKKCLVQDTDSRKAR